MAYEKIVRAVQLGKQKALDFRDTPIFGQELKDVIYDSVAYTQKFIIQELPNLLMITPKQWQSITPPEEWDTVENRMWVTDLNVMDVWIDLERSEGDTKILTELSDGK